MPECPICHDESLGGLCNSCREDMGFAPIKGNWFGANVDSDSDYDDED